MSGALQLYREDDRVVVNVRTGELLSLDEATLDDLADARDALGQLWHDRNTAAAILDTEIERRYHVALIANEPFGLTSRYTISVTGKGQRRDVDGLRGDLIAQALENRLGNWTVKRLEALFSVAKWKLDVRQWNKLISRDQQLAEIDQAHMVPCARSVRIDRRPIIEGIAEEVAS